MHWEWIALAASFTWALLVTIALLLIFRHLHKVDDLAVLVHKDLRTAEEELALAKAAHTKLSRQVSDERLKTNLLPYVGRFPAQPPGDTQSTGRHAKPEPNLP